MTTNALFNKDNERRGVAPIIATLLMVAIAVVGGILIFVFAQGFFGSSQVEGPAIESVTLLGYDARDVTDLDNHAGTEITDLGSGTTNDNRLTADAPIAFYFKNTGTQTLVISELSVAGETITFDGTAAFTNTTLAAGEYAILDGNSITAATATSTLSAGAETTVVAAVIDSPLKTGRTYSVEIGTGNGATFKFDFIAGIQKG
jgi:flagellin-like protein